jgi:hypothetical protein
MVALPCMSFHRNALHAQVRHSRADDLASTGIMTPGEMRLGDLVVAYWADVLFRSVHGTSPNCEKKDRQTLLKEHLSLYEKCLRVESKVRSAFKDNYRTRNGRTMKVETQWLTSPTTPEGSVRTIIQPAANAFVSAMA